MKKVTVMKLILITLLSFSLSSCMMMMPGHMSGSMEHSNNASSDARTDKVCGKTVEPESSFTYEYKGTNYYFDSEQCLTVFKNNPEHFVQKSADVSHKNMKTTMWIGSAIVMSAMMIAMMIIVF